MHSKFSGSCPEEKRGNAKALVPQLCAKVPWRPGINSIGAVRG